jgi:acyl carrier protein
MNDLYKRLVRCFAAAFPDVDEEALPTLQASGTETWDSVAIATVFALVQEEFGIEIDMPEKVEDLESFNGVYQYIASRLRQ